MATAVIVETSCDEIPAKLHGIWYGSTVPKIKVAIYTSVIIVSRIQNPGMPIVVNIL